MKLLDAALSYAARGWLVFPIQPGGKIPASKNGFKDATRDSLQIEKWWLARREFEARNIGAVTCPESGFWALDTDIDKETGEFGEDTLAELEAVHGKLPDGPRQRTPKGGVHRLFKWPDDGLPVPRRIRFAPGMDALGARVEGGETIAGYLIVAPSVRADGAYTWEVSPDECEIPYAPGWLLDMIRAEKSERPTDLPYAAPVFDAGTNAYGRKALTDICNAVASCRPGSQMDTLFRSAVRIGSLAGGGNIEWNEGFQNLVNAGVSMVAGDKSDPWTAKVVEKNVRKGMELGARDPTRIEPRANGYSRTIEHDDGEIRQGDNVPPPLGERPKPQLIVSNPEKPKAEKKEKPKASEWKGREWMADHSWILNDEGQLKASSLWNLQTYVRHCPQLKKLYWYDEFADEIFIGGPLPGDGPIGVYPRPIQDTDEQALASWLNSRGLSPGVAAAAGALREAAFHNMRNPFREWMDGLKWDGTKRIDTWLSYYGGANDTAYVRRVGRLFLISAVARGLSPGCKVDTMLVLEGEQGIKKSTLVRVLCGKDWFSDQVGDVTSKDASQLIQGIWIMEIPEMDKFSRAEANAVKDFLSRLFDRYRPPYGRNVVKRERRCVFLGTINPDGVGYLKDSTGNRRYLPVALTAIDIEGLERDRDQIWAEAKAAYEAGERWWLEEAEELAEAEPEQDARRDEDIWEPKIREWLDDGENWRFDAGRKFKAFTSSDVLWKAIGLELKHQKHAEKIRINKALALLGCVSVQHKNGIKGRSWQYDGESEYGKD